MKPRYIIKPQNQYTDKQRDNLKIRKAITEKCLLGMHPNASKTEKEYLQTVRQACKDDIFFWLEHFAMCYEPRKKTWLPFIPYKYQEEIIDLLIKAIVGNYDTNEGPSDLIIDKSRDMGLTWCVCLVFQWFWMFHDNFAFHIGSEKQDKVDILGDPSSIMGKIRGCIREQPGFLLPPDFDQDKCCRFLKLINPTTKSIITGESSNPDFARGGRYSAVFFDEFAFWNYDAEAWNSCGDSTPSRIAVSTPHGSYNKFAELRFNGQTNVYTAHWSMHPDKDNEWYAREKTRRTKHEVAQELDINYVSSVEGAIYNEFDPIRHISQNLKKEYPYKKHLVRMWDEGLTGAVLFCAKEDKTALILDEYIYHNVVDDNLVSSIIAYTNENFPDWTVDDEGDIAGKKRSREDADLNVKISFFDKLKRSFGINIKEKHRGEVEDGIKIVQGKLFRQDEFRIDAKCKKTIEALSGAYRRRKPPMGSNQTMPPAQEHPFEDVMDCMRYFIVDNFGIKKKHGGKNRTRRFKRT